MTNYLVVGLSFFLALCCYAGTNSDIAIPQKYRDFIAAHKDVSVSPEIQKHILDIKRVLSSPDYLKMTDDMQDRVDAIMEKDVPGYKPHSHGSDKADFVGDSVVLFASSSMPIDVLRRYARDLAKIHGVMVFRGMKGGISKLGPMMHFIGGITRVDQDCRGPMCVNLPVNVVIDPYLFRDNGISAVPAMVFLPQLSLASYCQRGADAHEDNKAADVIYGDASLHGMLEALDHIRRDIRIEAMLRKLEGA